MENFILPPPLFQHSLSRFIWNGLFRAKTVGGSDPGDFWA